MPASLPLKRGTGAVIKTADNAVETAQEDNMRFQFLSTDLDDGTTVTIERTAKGWVVQLLDVAKPHPLLRKDTRAVLGSSTFALRREALADYAAQGGHVWAAIDLDGHYGKVLRLFGDEAAAAAYVEREVKAFTSSPYGKNALTHLMWGARLVLANKKKGDRVFVGA